MIKNMNSKMTTNNYQHLNLKIQKQKLSKQLQQEQNHRNGDHVEGFQLGEGIMGEKVQGIRNIIGRHKMDRGRLRIV